MIGLGVLVVIVVVLAAAGIAARRQAAPAAGSAGEADGAAGETQAPPVGSAGSGRGAALERWVAAGLISAEQADAITAYERSAAGARGRPRERRVSLIAEALGYMGTALALAGAGVGLGQAWEDIPSWGRLAIAVAATALLVAGGAVLLRAKEPAFRRLMSVLWFLAVGGAAWALVVLGMEFLDLADDERMVLLVGVGTAAPAALLWAVRRYALQHAALFAALQAALIGGVLCLPGEAPLWVYALLVWALGAAWGLLGWFRALEPSWLAVALGSVGAVIGPAVGIGEYSWLLAFGLGTAVLLMVVSVPTGQVPLLAVGTLGTFAYLTWAVFHFFGESLSVPLALVIVGAVFIALAVVAGRLSQVTRGRRRRSRADASAG